jgi:hypothetical protein
VLRTLGPFKVELFVTMRLTPDGLSNNFSWTFLINNNVGPNYIIDAIDTTYGYYAGGRWDKGVNYFPDAAPTLAPSNTIKFSPVLWGARPNPAPSDAFTGR